jgi:hypothetical protein
MFGACSVELGNLEGMMIRLCVVTGAVLIDL